MRQSGQRQRLGPICERARCVVRRESILKLLFALQAFEIPGQIIDAHAAEILVPGDLRKNRAPDGHIPSPVSCRERLFAGDDYLLQLVVPNAFFHITMAYAILRHNGVELGKRDFLGSLRWIDG